MHIFTSVKFEKNRNNTVGGVAHTRYPLYIHFHCQNARKMTKYKIAKKKSEKKKKKKKNLRIISKPHAYLQSMVKTSINSEKNRRSCARKVHTPIVGRKDRRNDGKPKTMSLRFSSKRRMTKTEVVPTSTWKTVQ